MKIQKENGLELDNYKGVFYNDNKDVEYIDPITGAHFNHKEICKKLENYLKTQEISIRESNDKKYPEISLNAIKNQDNFLEMDKNLSKKSKVLFPQEGLIKIKDLKQSCINLEPYKIQNFIGDKYYKKINSQLLHSKYQSNIKFKKNSKMMQHQLVSQKTFHENLKSYMGIKDDGNIMGANYKLNKKVPAKKDKKTNIIFKGLKFRNENLSSRNMNRKQPKIFIGDFSETNNFKIDQNMNFSKLNRNDIKQRKNLSNLNFDHNFSNNLSQFQTISNHNLISTRNNKCTNNFSDIRENLQLFKSMNKPTKLTKNNGFLTKLYLGKKSPIVKGNGHNLIRKAEFFNTKINLASKTKLKANQKKRQFHFDLFPLEMKDKTKVSQINPIFLSNNIFKSFSP